MRTIRKAAMLCGIVLALSLFAFGCSKDDLEPSYICQFTLGNCAEMTLDKCHAALGQIVNSCEAYSSSELFYRNSPEQSIKRSSL